MGMSRGSADRSLAWASVAAVIAVASLALLLANISHLELGDQGQSIRPLINSLGQVVIWALLAIWVCIALILLGRYLNSNREGRMREIKPGGRSFGLLIALAVLIVLMLFVTTTNLQFASDGIGTAGQDDSGGAGNGEQSDGRISPQGTVMLVTFVAVVIVAIFFSLHYARKGRLFGQSLERGRVDQRARAIIEKAVEELRTTDDPRGAVIRTYWQMCRLFGQSTDGDDALTPREFARMVIIEHGWPETAVDRLTLIFEEARYSDHPIGEESRLAAIGCLKQIQDSLVRDRTGGRANAMAG